ncbi:MAG: murein biosynthesis integral membrane protein MurJ [Clostridia bacterium]|nr:murein biosynthesis integral membrane protein MurJ [Clostridia bacterium]
MKNNSQTKTVRIIGFMAVITFMAKVMGLLRETLIASVYGRTDAADIISTSTQIPLLFFDMTLGVAILSTFVPVFNKFLERDSKERAMDFANNFMTAVITFATAGAVLGMIFAEPLVRLMAPGYSPEKVAQTAKLLRILFPSIVFTAAAFTSVGILQSFGEFNIPALISAVSNLIMILYLIAAGNKFGLTGVIVSMLIAWASQLFIQIPALFKKGFRYRPRLNLKDEGIRDAVRLAIPVLISSWVQPLCVAINTAFGSFMGNGAVIALNWANKLYIIMVGVFAYAVTNFIFPKLSRLNAGDNNEGFSETTRTSLGWIIIIIALISALFVALSEPIIKIVFEYGQFSADDTSVTANALFFYSFGMVGYAICEILNKSFYAIRDGKTPMFASIFGIAVNFGAAFILVNSVKMGIGGLALASAISSWMMAIVLLFMINKRKGGTIPLSFVINMTKIIVAAILCGAVTYAIYPLLDFLEGGNIITSIRAGISALAGLLVYLLSAFVLRVDEFKQIRRFKNGN